MAKRKRLEELRTLATLLEPTREKLYRYVAGSQDPVSRDKAATTVGVSRAMAAFHLDRLVDAGLLRAAYRRLSGRTGRGAGRPAKLYRRSRRRFDVTVPQRDPELLARLLAVTIAGSTDTTPSLEPAQRYGRLLGARARRRLVEPDDEGAARCVEDVMADIGFEPISTGRETRARNCPFEPLSREFPDVVCPSAIAIVDGVIGGVGADTLSVSRRPRAHWCCVVVTGDPVSRAS